MTRDQLAWSIIIAVVEGLLLAAAIDVSKEIGERRHWLHLLAVWNLVPITFVALVWAIWTVAT